MWQLLQPLFSLSVIGSRHSLTFINKLSRKELLQSLMQFENYFVDFKFCLLSWMSVRVVNAFEMKFLQCKDVASGQTICNSVTSAPDMLGFFALHKRKKARNTILWKRYIELVFNIQYKKILDYSKSFELHSLLKNLRDITTRKVFKILVGVGSVYTVLVHCPGMYIFGPMQLYRVGLRIVDKNVLI
jgi:hypothetical protein